MHEDIEGDEKGPKKNTTHAIYSPHHSATALNLSEELHTTHHRDRRLWIEGEWRGEKYCRAKPERRNINLAIFSGANHVPEDVIRANLNFMGLNSTEGGIRTG